MSAARAYITAMSNVSLPARPCVICGKPQDAGLRPFCSRRCADIDLHRWLAGSYAIPAEEDPDDPAGDARPARDAGEA